MKSLRILIGSVAVILAASSAHGKMDRAATEALAKTQALLKSKSKRDAYDKNNSRAQAADSRVQDLTDSPAQQQQIYNISSDIFKSVLAISSI